MTDPTTMTPEQIRRKGLEALDRELGPVGMARFLQQFETGHGDYATDRHRWLPASDVRALATDIRRDRSEASASERR